MGKIYYSIDTTTTGFPVHWIDASGNNHVDLVKGNSPADVDQEFHIAQRGAIYLKWDAFCARLAMIAHEKEELARWNAGASL